MTLIIAIAGVAVSVFKENLINNVFDYSIETVILCSDSFGCGAFAGISRELDGGTGGSDPVDIAELICRNNGGDYSAHEIMNKPTDCALNYGLGLIENNQIVHKEVPICSLGADDVIKTIECSR